MIYSNNVLIGVEILKMKEKQLGQQECRRGSQESEGMSSDVEDDSGSGRCHEVAVGKKRLEACAIRAIREAQQLIAGSQEAVGVGSRRRERVRVTRALAQANRRTKSEGQEGGRSVGSSAVLGFERPLRLDRVCLLPLLCVGSSLTRQPLCASILCPPSPQLQRGTFSSHLREVQRLLFRS